VSSNTSNTSNSTATVTRDDLLSKMQELDRAATNTFASSQEMLKKVGIVAAIVLIILVFLLGRRRGKLAKTVVEIRRL
jgi:hypothetical protein